MGDTVWYTLGLLYRSYYFIFY